METKTRIEANVEQVAPFFAVSDMETSLRFYLDGLGFEMTTKWINEGKLRRCWLQLGGAALMLQELRKDGNDSWAPSCRVGEGVSLYFICKDALAIYRDLKAHGTDASRPQVGNSMWVTGVTDPDGYKLFFESPTDAPEETFLDE